MNSFKIPTDNFYKFCAISGIVLTLFGLIGGMSKIANTHEEFIEERREYRLENDKALKKEMLPKLGNLNTMTNALVLAIPAVVVAGVILSLYGFFKWKTEIQPKHDKLIDLEIEQKEQELIKIRLENERLKKDGSDPTS